MTQPSQPNVPRELHCDFCHTPNPAHLFPHQAFSVDRLPYQEAGPGSFYFEAGEWAACDTCTALLKAGDWDGLLDRAMAANRDVVGEDGYYRQIARRAYQKLRQALGPEVQR